MARGQAGDLLQAGEKDRIGIDQKCLNATPNKAFEYDVNVALAAGLSENELKPEHTSRVMQIRYNGLDVRIGRIGEKTDDFCRGDEFAQHLEPFRCHRNLEQADAGDIAARPVEALDENKSDGVDVAFLAAAKGAGPPMVIMTATCRLTKSAASAGNRSS